MLEAVFHAAERDEIDSGSRESITHKVPELPVREGCHLFAGRKREGYALDIGRRMRLAQNVSVEHEELETAGLQLFEDIRVGDNGAVVLGMYGDVELTARFSSDRVPQLGQINMKVAARRLRMILARHDALGSGGP